MKVKTPILVGNMTVPNRILRSATMENMADSNGFVTEDLKRLYTTVARGGAGLIVVGASAVESRGRVWKHQIAIWDDNFIDSLRMIPEAIHQNGSGKCAIQLHHGGAAGFGYSYGSKRGRAGYKLSLFI